MVFTIQEQRHLPVLSFLERAALKLVNSVPPHMSLDFLIRYPSARAQSEKIHESPCAGSSGGAFGSPLPHSDTITSFPSQILRRLLFPALVPWDRESCLGLAPLVPQWGPLLLTYPSRSLIATLWVWDLSVPRLHLFY